MVTQAEISTRLNDAKETGRREAVLAMAKKMLARQMELSDISDLSGLSIAEIKAIKA